jgi:hypothetical protein
MQSDLRRDDNTNNATIPPLSATRPSTPTPDRLATSAIQPTEQQAESILKLLFANLDRGDVRTIAMKMMPEYTKLCLTSFECEELRSALRRLYRTRYSELQLSLHRMDKLGLLLRRIEYLAEQDALDAQQIRPHGDHHRKRRPGDFHPKLQRARQEEAPPWS